MTAICMIPNCRKQAPADDAFCVEHRDAEDPKVTIARLRRLLAEAVMREHRQASQRKWYADALARLLKRPQK